MSMVQFYPSSFIIEIQQIKVLREVTHNQMRTSMTQGMMQWSLCRPMRKPAFCPLQGLACVVECKGHIIQGCVPWNETQRLTRMFNLTWPNVVLMASMYLFIVLFSAALEQYVPSLELVNRKLPFGLAESGVCFQSSDGWWGFIYCLVS